MKLHEKLATLQVLRTFIGDTEASKVALELANEANAKALEIVKSISVKKIKK